MKMDIAGGGDKVEFGSIWWCLMVVDKLKYNKKNYICSKQISFPATYIATAI